MAQQKKQSSQHTLHIVKNKNGNGNLSKEQKAFNRLTKRIENLEKEIKKTRVKFEVIFEEFITKVKPLTIERAKNQLLMATAIDAATTRYKFTQKQLEQISVVICNIISTASELIDLNKDQEALYDKWSETSYQEELEMAEEEGRKMAEDMIKNMFGMNIDLSEFDISNPDNTNFSELQEKLLEGMKAKEAAEQEKENKRKKTKKQIEREQIEKANDLLKQKSIRNIYITLAKLLHPDTEPDIKKREEKEEIMKQVTKAYDTKDLSTLLKLEMEWVHKTSEHLNELQPKQLKVYIEALKQQVKELEAERNMMYNNPRYNEVEPLLHMSEKAALYEIEDEKLRIEEQLYIATDDLKTFSRKGAKTHITGYVNTIYNHLTQQDIMQDFLLNMAMSDDDEGMFW